MNKLLLFSVGMACMISCKQEMPKVHITNPEDYNRYLTTKNTPTLDEAMAEKQFWSNRMDKDTMGLGEIGPLAGVYERLFAQTGNMEYLLAAEQLYKKGISIAAENYKDGMERGLAQNYISQHRFKEANQILEESFKGVSNKRVTALMLFDAAMELGEYKRADDYLTELKDMSDYNYLIRLAKWSDHLGDLDSAIRFMEMAKEKAEARNSKPLKIWTYSNLADYYGHAGRLEDSYSHYLKTLALQPDNTHVKKGIAWLVYSGEGNAREAHRILDSVMKNHHVPDYYLLKAEMYAFQNNDEASKTAENQFVQAVEDGNYGNMYNTYLIELYAESNPSKALTLARQELKNRATPEIYHWLAYAQLKNGMEKQALETMQKYVEGNTFEPMALYHSALIYKANGNSDKADELQDELLLASYELGPMLTQEVKNL